MNYVSYVKKQFQPHLESFFDDIKAARDKENFRPSGMQMYSGMQGSGKTLSAVNHLIKLVERYPKAIVVTNLELKFLKKITPQEYEQRGIKRGEYIFFESMDEASYVLTHVNNDKYGVIYLIDEIHTYFNALDSKNIPMYIFTEISQQRKQHKVILATSQLFLRMAKPFREQCDNVIKCNTILGFFTMNIAYDGAKLSEEGKEDKEVHARRMGFFFHTRKIREAYDTYQKVVSGAEQYDLQHSTKIKGLKIGNNNKLEIV